MNEVVIGQVPSRAWLAVVRGHKVYHMWSFIQAASGRGYQYILTGQLSSCLLTPFVLPAALWIYLDSQNQSRGP